MQTILLLRTFSWLKFKWKIILIVVVHKLLLLHYYYNEKCDIWSRENATDVTSYGVLRQKKGIFMEIITEPVQIVPQFKYVFFLKKNRINMMLKCVWCYGMLVDAYCWGVLIAKACWCWGVFMLRHVEAEACWRWSVLMLRRVDD